MIVAISPRSFRNTPGRHLELLERSPLEPRFPEVERHLDETEMQELVRGCQALIVGIDPVTEAVLRAGPLRIVAKYGSGMDNIDLEAASRLGVKVGSTPGANSRAVAELTIGLAFALARHLAFHDRAVRGGSWERRVGFELAGRHLGVIGVGEVGSRVARLGTAIGMKVVGHDPDPAVEDVPLVDLRQLLATSDVVSIHVPLNEETRHLIDAAALASMKTGSMLINTARGGLVEEEALAQALRSGHLAGAAADDLDDPEDSPLLKLDNFLATPHAGAATVEAIERTGVAALRLVLAEIGWRK